MKKILILFLFIPLFACDDWLEVEPEDSVTFVNYFKSESELEALYNVVQSKMKYICFGKQPYFYSSIDADDVQADVEDGEEQELASTITVLATPEQARLLAELEQTGKLHAALVFRGDSTQAQKFLDEQQKVLEELYTEELEGEAETAEADAEEETEEPIVDDVEVDAGGQ